MVKKEKASRKKQPSTTSASSAEQELDSPYHSLMLRKAQAVDLLNGAKMPMKFRFREKEMARMETFLQICLSGEKKGLRFLMVTGAPGAGKTLSANAVLSGKGCKVISMNANIVKTLQEAQRTIAAELLGKIGEGPLTALQIINQLEEAEYRQACVVCIQQVELLFKNDPTPLTEDFLKLFQKKGLRLILIGISNTIDTLLKSSKKFGFKMQDIENIIFSPYTAAHIAEIIKDKLGEVYSETGLKITFQERILRFAALKLEALRKGDFRVCLFFLKGVVQMVLQGDGREVRIEEVNAVLANMSEAKHMTIENLPSQLQVMLIAIYLLFRNSDALCVTPAQLQGQLGKVCRSVHMQSSKQLLTQGLSELQQYSLVEVRQRKEGQKIMLKVGLHEIETALREVGIFRKFFNGVQA